MKLKDSLYRCRPVAASDEGFAYKVVFNAECVIYKAHFPGEPITPGACILQIAQELLEDHFSCPTEIRMVKNVKFLNIIVPDQTPEVEYFFSNVKCEGPQLSLQVTVCAGETIYAKMSLKCILTTD